MSIAFRCPCGRSLRAAPEQAGKKTKCPGCGNVLTIPSANGDGAAAPAPRPASSAGGAVVTCGCGKKIATKAEWAGKLIKCPGCGEKIKVPGGTTAPAKPAAAKRPSPPPPPLPEEDEDEIEEEEEAPRKKKGGKKSGSGSSKTLIFAGLGLLLVGLLGGAGWFFFLRDATPPRTVAKAKVDLKTSLVPANEPPPAKVEEAPPAVKADGDPPVVAKKAPVPVTPSPARGAVGGPSVLELIPADAIGFAVLRVGDFMQTPSAKKLVAMAGPLYDKQNQETRAKLGIGAEDVRETAVVILAPSPEGVYTVATTSKPVKTESLEAGDLMGQKVVKKEVDGKVLYVLTDQGGKSGAIHLLSPQQILAGEEQAITAVLSRPVATDGPLANSLKAAAADPSHLYVAFLVPPEFTEMAKSKLPPAGEGFKPLVEVSEGQITLHEDKAIRLVGKLKYPDAAKAEEAKKAVDGLIAMAGFALPGMKKGLPPGMDRLHKVAESALASVKPSLNGDVVQIPVTVDLTFGEIAELALPAIMKVKMAAAGAQGSNNLRQLALAMHNHHAAFGGLPEAKVGAGLSWRVAMLPYLEQDVLAKQFKMDEPWDSEHNKKFLEAMPAAFVHPSRPAPPGHTYFRVFSGPHTLFQDGQKITLPKVKDGTSNTLLIVEAEQAVPWTKPDELVFNPDGPLPTLGDPMMGGTFLGAFADGSVRTFRMIDPETLKALITMDGGEVIDPAKIR